MTEINHKNSITYVTLKVLLWPHFFIRLNQIPISEKPLCSVRVDQISNNLSQVCHSLNPLTLKLNNNNKVKS